MPPQDASVPQPAAERSLAVRQLEGQLALIHADGHGLPHHLGGVRGPAALHGQGAAGERPEPALRFPEALQVARRQRDGDQQEDDPDRSDFNHWFPLY